MGRVQGCTWGSVARNAGIFGENSRWFGRSVVHLRQYEFNQEDSCSQFLFFITIVVGYRGVIFYAAQNFVHAFALHVVTAYAPVYVYLILRVAIYGRMVVITEEASWNSDLSALSWRGSVLACESKLLIAVAFVAQCFPDGALYDLVWNKSDCRSWCPCCFEWWSPTLVRFISTGFAYSWFEVRYSFVERFEAEQSWTRNRRSIPLRTLRQGLEIVATSTIKISRRIYRR